MRHTGRQFLEVMEVTHPRPPLPPLPVRLPHCHAHGSDDCWTGCCAAPSSLKGHPFRPCPAQRYVERPAAYLATWVVCCVTAEMWLWLLLAQWDSGGELPGHNQEVEMG